MERLNYPLIYQHMANHPRLSNWLVGLPEQVAQRLSPQQHGNFSNWLNSLHQLPDLASSHIEIDQDTIRIQGTSPSTSQSDLTDLLQQFHPWRKGPYHIHGIDIDTEWRSDWKWQRLAEHISDLSHRVVLDVGCGNGYHAWRMLGAGAELVIGIDPGLLSVMQFQVLQHFIGTRPISVLPLALEDLPDDLHAFDTVFSMGVLYHRRSPFDHLYQLRACLRAGGELVLETLVIDGELGESLVPEGRYAQMRNVWFLPSCATLISWLTRCGFEHIRVIDVSTTQTSEQRSTPWMRFDSLSDFLSPNDPHYTIENHPSPKRAILIARAKA